VRRRGTTGEDFAVLAAEVSDSPSKANAGLVGPISLADLSPEIRTALEGLKAGDVSPVIKSAAGFQILKIETLTEKETLPYDKARDRISEQVFQRKQQEEFLKYLGKLRAQAIIEWKSPELQKAYEQGLKAGIVPEA
jgi:peptidyl-prolyl cis-trans isomerase SurA